MTIDTPDDLDYEDLSYEDGYSEQRGVEHCPTCGRIYSANGGYIEEVWDRWGNRYADRMESDPEDGPFWCKYCWPEVRGEVLYAVRGVEHVTLDEFQE